ncbi:c-Myc-binding protein homolog [Scaptodrosophila lebanonensis]|uniref:c-Myc-binding protein homolog n=1 Tax=Drosophila lebanonensis TaxID=7225 RepID=A0A6J2T4H9_DROLE|nr:c-Myc-binding protein homolog [Scaptodrosophila lebanonensis]
MSFKPIDPKRDEVRRYLERGSVLDSLTKIFIRIIKERPENPMEYIRNNIGVVRHQHDKYERLQQDLQVANKEILRLRGIINSIDPQVLQEPPQHPPIPVDIETNLNNFEPGTIPKEEDPTSYEHTEEANVFTAELKNEDGFANGDEVLASAVDNCHLDDDKATQSESSNQNISVRVEQGSNDNTE